MVVEQSHKIMLEPQNCHTSTKAGQDGTLLQGKYRTTRVSALLHGHILCLIINVVLVAVILPVILTVVVSKRRYPLSDVHVQPACPPMWIGFGDKCFYFSEDTGNWTFSQNFCDSLEAKLVQIDTQEELNFLTRYKGPDDHWIGLNRESPRHSWKWTNNTADNIVFKVRGSGECAYLNDNGVSSGKVYLDRKWICNKPNSHVSLCQTTSNS